VINRFVIALNLSTPETPPIDTLSNPGCGDGPPAVKKSLAGANLSCQTISPLSIVTGNVDAGRPAIEDSKYELNNTNLKG
jgi:hypothetical protein